MFYGLLFWTSLKDVVREGERRYQRPLTDTIKKKKKNKTEISGCGSFVVADFQPATFIDCLHVEPFLLLVKVHGLGGRPSPMNTDVKSVTFT